MSAAGRADDKLNAAGAGLAEIYIPDRGNDSYDRPRTRWVRRDMAAFLLRVRAQDPELADSLGWQLQAIPPAWCSLVLPRRTVEQLDAQVAAANGMGQALAAAIGVSFVAPVDERKARLLRFARTEAGRRFCPEQANAPGHALTDQVAAVARMPGDGTKANVLDSALPVAYSPGWLPRGGSTDIGLRELRLAYVGILVGSARVGSRTWPVALDCPQVQAVMQPAYIVNTANNIKDLLRQGLETTQEAVKNVTDMAAEAFDATENQRFC